MDRNGRRGPNRIAVFEFAIQFRTFNRSFWLKRFAGAGKVITFALLGASASAMDHSVSRWQTEKDNQDAQSTSAIAEDSLINGSRRGQRGSTESEDSSAGGNARGQKGFADSAVSGTARGPKGFAVSLDPAESSSGLAPANGGAALAGVVEDSPAVKERDARLLEKIKTWSLEDRAGQLLMVGFRSFEQLKKSRPGGVVLFSWSLEDIDQTKKLITKVKQYAAKNLRSPLFVAIDHEGGKVLRLRKGMTFFPDAAAVGALKDPEMAFRFGAAMGLELSSLGIHMNFAPVLDLGNARSFLENRVWGDDPATVAELTRSYIEGLYSSRILAIPKHFPGHGGTHQDSHFFLPVISKSFERLWREDLVPFRTAIRDSIAGVMTAHVEIPSVDRIPASLSENFLQKLLRDRLGFKGLIITDDLEMAGVSKVLPEPPEQLAFRALKAGTNMILVVWSENTQIQIIRRLVSAVKTGEVSEDWLNQKVLKVQHLKAEYFGEGMPENPYWHENFRRPETLKLASEIFHKAPAWQAGFESSITQAFRNRWKESWSVVLPSTRLVEYWKTQRPHDTIFVVPKRAGEPELKHLHSWLQRQITGPKPLWVVTGPRASSSEEAFQVIRKDLGGVVGSKSSKLAMIWVHQGASPVALPKDGDKIPLGIVSLYSGSISGFKEFFNSLRQAPDARQISSVVPISSGNP